MEHLLLPPSNGIAKPELVAENSQPESMASPFIIGNSEEVSFHEIKSKHIIPVYVKDNEPLISHSDFIEGTWEVVNHFYGDGSATAPQVRASHPIKGRVPDARHKKAAELLEDEKTLYYERMMFIMEIPCNYDVIDGNKLTLTVGGVKSYSEDNLYNKKGAFEHFKVFAGFKNMVCTNMCVHSDGMVADLKVSNTVELRNKIFEFLSNYNALEHLRSMQHLPEKFLTEKQFAQLIGRARMYQHLSAEQKSNIPLLSFGDNQINAVCKEYYKDDSFCRDEKGNINLWKLYNLFTGANKSSYIDSYLTRAVNASSFVNDIALALDQGKDNWFLS